MTTPILESEGTRQAKAELRSLIAKTDAAAAKKEKKFTPSQAAAMLGRLGGLANKGRPCPARARTSEQARKAVMVRWERQRRAQALGASRKAR